MKKNPFWLSLRAILSLFFRGFVFFPPLLFLFLFSSDLYSAPPACDVNCFKPALDAAKAGSGAAENRMGTMFATGVGAPYAPQVAAAWYERAARQGHAGASINLGMLYLTGQGVAEDTQQAYQWIEKAAKLGSGEANHLLGMLYERGMGVAADVEEARRLYKKAGEQGSLLARTEWTRLSNNPWLDDAPLPVVTAQKTSLARHGTKRGVPVSNPSPQDSQQTLARDVSKPVVVAVPKVEPASVGNQRVSALLQKTRDAALVGDLEAQNHLGTMVLSGFGIEPRPKEAFHWFQSAADAGHPRAQINLASMMLTGMGTEEDPIEAARWLEQAAAQNHPEAQSLLASMYEKGKGVGKNEVKALQWYSLAAGQGQGDAVKARDRLMASMSPNDVAKAVGGMKSFLVQHNQKTVQPQEIQLASLKLDDASAAPMGGHTLRGIADVKPEPPLVSNREASSSAAQTDKRAKRGVAKQTQVASAAEAKPDSKSQPPAASDQWEIEVGDGNAGKNLAETKRARVAYVPLLSVPAVKKVDDQGQKGAEAELGQAIAAGEKKDLDAVRKHLTTAHEQDSLNPEVAKRLGILAMEGGKPDEALPYFKAAAQGAALKGMVPEATFANERIDEILSIAPPWVEEKLAAASAVKPDKTSAVSTWSGLLEQAMARAQEGDLPKAITLGQQALDLARKDLGDEHASTILTQREMGNIFVQNGQLDAAEPLFQQSAAQGEKVLGDTHPETLAAKALLAELRESRMQLDGAVAAYREISASYNKGFGPNNPSKLQTDLSLARVLKNQGNTAESDKVVRATCPQVAQVYGYYHAETAACLQQLAEILRAQGDSEAALKELQQALAINAGILPRQDPRVVGGQITLAGIQKDLGHFSDAKKNLLTVLDDIKADAGPLGFLQSDASTVLARVHMDMGEFDQAQSLTKALYEEHKAKLGSDHPNTLAALADLAGIKEKKGLFDEAEKS
ncbi:MAG TPA: SEL1-like repeat protein, partial [Magnetococcales bacterium]|nr:SEL1-like repeat protein [Magnetococcales bacterium]